jgi:hypothetical protein
MLIEAR